VKRQRLATVYERPCESVPSSFVCQCRPLLRNVYSDHTSVCGLSGAGGRWCSSRRRPRNLSVVDGRQSGSLCRHYAVSVIMSPAWLPSDATAEPAQRHRQRYHSGGGGVDGQVRRGRSGVDVLAVGSCLYRPTDLAMCLAVSQRQRHLPGCVGLDRLWRATVGRSAVHWSELDQQKALILDRDIHV